MSIQKDVNGVYTPTRENLLVLGSLASVNAEILIDVISWTTTSDTITKKWGWEGIAILEVRGTFVWTISIEWSVNGTDYTPIVMTNGLSTLTTAWLYKVNCAGYSEIRARMTAYTSGTANCALSISIWSITERGTTAVSNGLGTANTATTLTIPAVVWMRHYITGIEIWRVNGTASAVTGSALLAVTSTNLPTNFGWNFWNGIIAWWHEKLVDMSFDSPLVSTTAWTATTIVMPAGGAWVQWRCNVRYRLGE